MCNDVSQRTFFSEAPMSLAPNVAVMLGIKWVHSAPVAG